MKFQIPKKVNTHTHTRTHRQTDRQTDKPKAICPSNFFKVGGIKRKSYFEKSHCSSLIRASPGLNINSVIQESATSSV